MNDTPATPTPDTPTGLAAAKLAVMAEVPYLKKCKVQGLNYSFASEREFIRRLHPALIRHGLAFAPIRTQLLYHEQYQSGGGKAMHRVVLTVRYRLTHVASGQSELIEAAGEGSDIGDKATSKAMTSALKYALRQTFLVETGDDPDRTPSTGQQHAGQPAPAAPNRPRSAPAANGRADAPRPPAAPQHDPAEVLTAADHQVFVQLLFRHQRTWEKCRTWLRGREPAFPEAGQSTDLTYRQAGLIRKALEGKAARQQAQGKPS